MGSLFIALVFFLAPPYLPMWPQIIGLPALFAVSVWSAQAVAGAQRRVVAGKIDPQEIVIDEVMGMAVTLAFLPLNVKTIVLGFLLFRIFDVAKPFPVRRLEKLPGGWGIVMDDVMAGVYANLSLRIILIF
jgi:phosphatidylglycerophosphatase A